MVDFDAAFRRLTGNAPFPQRHRLRVMELTATSRGDTETFGLTDNDRDHELVKRRVGERTVIELREGRDGKLAEDLVSAALEHKDSGRPVLVFAKTVDDVLTVKTGLD